MESTAIERPRPEAAEPPTFLDRTLDLTAVSWAAVAWVAALAAAVALRFANLDFLALAPEEASRAFDAWTLYQGRPTLPGQDLPETAPLFLLLQSLGFFLFGTSDATARMMPALLGLGLVGLTYALRPFVGKPAALGMAILAALSPTLVFTSRTANPEIVVAFLSLLLVGAVLRLGATDSPEGTARRWAVVAGVTFGALLAAGPSAITVLLCLAAGVVFGALLDGDGAMARGLGALTRVPGAALSALAAAIATGLTLFTRLFSDLDAIVGLGRTVADWGELLAERSGGTPSQFFLLALLLYEPLALLLGLIASIRGRINRSGGLGWPFLAGWFAAALLLWSFSTGREPGHAVHVALPLVLLGGGVLGDLLAGLDHRDTLRGRGGALFLTLLGLAVGLIAFAILASRIDTAVGDQERPAILQTAVVALLVVLPLGYAAWILIGVERAEGRTRQPPLLALLVPALLLGAFTLRSSILLDLYRADDGTELLAQRTTTAAVRPAIERLMRLSRDVTILDGSVRDTPGGRGLSIAADQSVRWPFQWYFREFPEFAVVDAGQATTAEAQVVIAPDDAGMAEAGYTPRLYTWVNRVPGAYADLASGRVLRSLVTPGRWLNGSRYLLYRDGLTPGDPETVAIGLNGELAARVFPSVGPYGLADRQGEGLARGQFNQPIGVAAAPGGTVYVVDQGNSRVQRFDAAGDFVGIWGGEEGSAVDFARTENGLGPTGIAVGPDGLVYVADTWNHRVVVFNPAGEIIREIGGPPDDTGDDLFADTGDDPAAADTKTGSFFGPRAVAVTAEEVYVVDTGNERVQVFGIDGTFKRVWGGYGTEPERFIEPVGIALGPDGLVYVADSGNARISRFTPAGDPVDQWPVAAWPAPDPSGIRPAFQPYLAFAPDGTLYASSSDTGSVEVFGPTGAPLRAIRDVAGDPLQQPIGVAIAPDGTVLITDIGRDAVYQYTPPVVPPTIELLPLPDQPPVVPPTIELLPLPDQPPVGGTPDAAPTSQSIPPPPE